MGVLVHESKVNVGADLYFVLSIAILAQVESAPMPFPVHACVFLRFGYAKQFYKVRFPLGTPICAALGLKCVPWLLL